MTCLDDLLNARPTKDNWWRVCQLLARMDATELAAVAPRVLSWPAQQRPMPDDWWAEWTSGQPRPYHQLAGVRHLGTLQHVEAGCAHVDSGACAEDGQKEHAYFFNGTAAVAAPADLSWLAVCAAAEWHHNGGDIVGWNTVFDDALIWFVQGATCHDEATEIQISPDGRTVVGALLNTWHAWSARTGSELWTIPMEEMDEENEYDNLVRVCFSGDGRLVALGTTESPMVTVIEVATGRAVFTVPFEEAAFGPVALDAEGRFLAHCAPPDQVVVRNLDDGVVLATTRTGLAEAHALAFAPDGTGLFAVGCALAEAAPPDPATRVLRLEPASDGLRITLGELVRLARPWDLSEVRGGPMSCWTHAVWTGRGPVAFVCESEGSLLFDSAGRTLWADPESMPAAFTPDGRALVTAGDNVNAWFLTGLTMPGAGQAAAGWQGVQ